MVTKVKKGETSSAGASKFGADFKGTVKDSAQQIWLAGLGAFSKAQEEGGKVFDALVKEGSTLQRKTQSVAEDRITEATGRMASMASDISNKASGQWDKLENIFEDRVSRALKKLGVPTHKEIESLIGRLEELNRLVAKFSGMTAAKPAAARKTPAKKTPAKKSAAKKTPAKKAAKRPARKAA